MLSVGCSPSIATRWLVPRLPGFRAAHPGIEIKVVYARAEERLGGGDNDVLITLGADPSANVASRKLFSRTSRPVCSPHYIKATKLDTPHRIARADLLHDETRSGWQLWLDEAGLRNADVGNGPIFADFNMLATAVIAGHGVALCPVEVFRDELRRGDLVVLSDIATDQDEGYYLTMSEHAKPAARTFADWFSAEISRDAPSA
jgi:LysR family glycine cleavage system transcriptional activator